MTGPFTLDYAMSVGFWTQLVCSAFALTGQWLMGNKWRWAPAIGLAGQFAWFAMIVTNGVWGLLFSNVPMTFVHAVSLWKWLRSPS